MNLEKFSRIVWVLFGIYLSLLISIRLVSPMATEQGIEPYMVWWLGGAVAVLAALGGNLAAGRNYSSTVKAEPEEPRECFGLSMAYSAISGLVLGALVSAVLFGFSAILGFIEVPNGLGSLVLNSMSLGGSHGVLSGLFVGFIIGGYAAYGLYEGKDVSEL